MERGRGVARASTIVIFGAEGQIQHATGASAERYFIARVVTPCYLERTEVDFPPKCGGSESKAVHREALAEKRAPVKFQSVPPQKALQALIEMDGKILVFSRLLLLEDDGLSKLRKNSKIDITVTDNSCKPS